MTPNAETELLFLLLRAGLRTEKPDDGERLGALCAERTPDWSGLYGQAVRQGVLAIAWDGLNRFVQDRAIAPERLPDRRLKLQWGFNVERIERTYAKQWSVARELAERYAGAGIRTIVLKGFAAAADYPVPEHRPCGDLDCFLMGGYERGNRLAEQYGARVERDHYKHSHILYKGLTIENHQFCTAIRGSRRAKAFERELQNDLSESAPRFLNGSHLETPSPQFNALFLTVHAWGHFLSEGLTLRHLCDWALLLHAAGGRIDWNRFRESSVRRDRGMYAFAESTVRLAHLFLGVAVPQGLEIDTTLSERDERLLHDTLFDRNPVFNSEGTNWQKRSRIIGNMLHTRWKHKYFSDLSPLGEVLQKVGAYLFERTPRI